MGFLDRERLTIYPIIFLTLYLLIGGYWILGGLVTGKGPTDRIGKPVGGDFVQYWAASHLALNGKAAEVYNPGLFIEKEQQVTGAFFPIPWLYSPTFLLMVLPFCLFPFLASLAIWLASTLAGYLVVLRRIAPQSAACWLALAFPGTFMNLIHGQNGFLSAGLLGGGLLLIEQRPLLAGALFGLLTFKPHLTLLLPVALAAGRYWKTLAAMILTFAVLTISSALILGTQVWIAFGKNIPFTMKLLTGGFLHLYKMPTVFAAVMLAGGSVNLAYVLQGLISGGMILLVVWTWLRITPLPIRASILVVAILLATPYAFEYDLTILALPLAWLGMEVLSTGWLPLEQTVMAATWLLPMVAPYLARLTDCQISPLVLLLLLALLLRRAGLSPTSLQPAFNR